MKKVLFIDDSDDNLSLYKIYFKKNENVEADFEIDPQKGIELCLNNKYDFMFIDIQMPILDGFKVLEEIGDQDGKVYALTAHSDQATITKIEESKFDGYLSKPILKKDLTSVVENG